MSDPALLSVFERLVIAGQVELRERPIRTMEVHLVAPPRGPSSDIRLRPRIAHR